MNRYPRSKVFDYCLNPLHLVDEEKDVFVPCGKCEGCRLYASNVWTNRLSNEIDDQPHSLFVTLTYNNTFLPKLVAVTDNQLGLNTWSSDHPFNWRFAVSRCSRRNDNISVIGNFKPIAVTNFDKFPCIPYASKLDIQLYFKLLRKSLDLYGLKKQDGYGFRYFAISEYGETLYRPHYHIVFFPSCYEVSHFFVRSALYENWQMCDKDLFYERCVESCDSGTANYVSSYVNGNSSLPEVYKCEDLRPFRLASKNPPIGFISHDREEVCENVSVGNIEYNRVIPRLENKYVFRYSKKYLSSIFPKCTQFSRKSLSELLFIYGACYRGSRSKEDKGIKVNGVEFGFFAYGLSVIMRSSDYIASRKCFQICSELGCTPFHYLYLLDMAYYKADMFALESFYKFQESKGNDIKVLFLYNNVSDFIASVRNGTATQLEALALDFFLDSFGIDCLGLFDNSDLTRFESYKPDPEYVSELSDILDGLVKMPKFNESIGVSPVNQYI